MYWVHSCMLCSTGNVVSDRELSTPQIPPVTAQRSQCTPAGQPRSIERCAAAVIPANVPSVHDCQLNKKLVTASTERNHPCRRAEPETM